MTESERLDQALTVIDANKWRYRAELAEAAAMALQAERDYWEARCKRAEDEVINTDGELDSIRVTLSTVPVAAIRELRSWDQGWMEQANCIAAIDRWLATLSDGQMA